MNGDVLVFNLDLVFNEIALFAVLIILFLIVFAVLIKLKNSNLSNNKDFLSQGKGNNDLRFSSDEISFENEKKIIFNDTQINVFEKIINQIEHGFTPSSGINEEDFERQLLSFLDQKFPDNMKTRGHTRSGGKIDIIIDGTYAIELITVDHEGKLFSLLNMIANSKQDFSKAAVVLINVGNVSSDKIQKYVEEMKKLDIKAVVKNISSV